MRKRFALTKAETDLFLNCIQDLLNNPDVQKMKTFIHHGHTTCYIHCVCVAYFAFLFALRTHSNVNLSDLTRGAMLHDFFLYDWHEKNAGHPHNLHGFQHPAIALKNAEKCFDLDAVEKDIIKHHMWPLTPALPHYKETYVITLADKYCAIAERFCIVPSAASKIFTQNGCILPKK